MWYNKNVLYPPAKVNKTDTKILGMIQGQPEPSGRDRGSAAGCNVTRWIMTVQGLSTNVIPTYTHREIRIITSPFNTTHRLLWAINAHSSKGRRDCRLFTLRYPIVGGRREREGEMARLKAHERPRKALLNRMRESISWPSVFLLLLLSPSSLKSRQDCVYVDVFSPWFERD